MKTAYRKIRLSPANKVRLGEINSIIEEYRLDGYVLTLRQLYYQLVSRDIIPNQQKEYKNLSKLLGEGRMAGYVDWEAIEDRMRKVEKPSCWDTPMDILQTAVRQYRRDNMENQPCRIEVWVEKDALSGVLERVTSKYGIGLQVQRGYGSITALKNAYERVIEDDRKFHILYLGDHDPSGLDMLRDIENRIFEFWWGDNQGSDEPCPKNFMDSPCYPEFADRFEIVPIALTSAQIKQYSPPPNPAKMTDPRSGNYVDEHGNTSYEVDALPPKVLNRILTDAITDLMDLDEYDRSLERQKAEKWVMKEAISKMDFGSGKRSDEEE